MQPTRRVDLEAVSSEMDLLAEIVKDRHLASLERLQPIASISNRENDAMRSIAIKEERERFSFRVRLRRKAVRLDVLEVIAHFVGQKPHLHRAHLFCTVGKHHDAASEEIRKSAHKKSDRIATIAQLLC